MRNYIKKYIVSQKEVLGHLSFEKLADVVQLFKQVLDNGRQVFVFGNGGSAANASHFVTDLGKGSSDKTYKRFRCLSLNDNISWMTALSNDYSYDEVFVRQLMNLATIGDIAFVMSVSGNSPNLIRAVEWCKKNGIYSIILVGNNKGRLAEMGDMVVVADDSHYGRVEDAHMTICHIIAYAFMEIPALQNP